MGYQPVPITGLSFVSSIGSTIDDMVKNLSTQKRGLSFQHRFKEFIKAPLGEVQFQTSGILTPQDVIANQLHFSITEIAKKTKVFERYKPEEIGFFFGTSTAETYSLLRQIELMFADKKTCLENYLSPKNNHGFLVETMKEFFPIKGINATLTTACSSAASAIAEGFYAINSGLVKACFVGGFDILNPLTICGFNALQIHDNQYCVPFSIQRKGMNLSEGGGLFLLEKYKAGTNNQTHAFVKGVGGASDAFHMINSNPEGFGATLSMINALNCAGFLPENIDYINAHGTGTQSNDASESTAVAKLFKTPTPISSTKAFHGHALGGSAAIELVVCIAALQNQKLWCGIFEDHEYGNTICHAKQGLLKKPLQNIMSNSFGFGGNNMSLILGRTWK